MRLLYILRAGWFAAADLLGRLNVNRIVRLLWFVTWQVGENASESLLEVADRLDPNSVRIADRAEPVFLFFAQIGSAGHVVR